MLDNPRSQAGRELEPNRILEHPDGGIGPDMAFCVEKETVGARARLEPGELTSHLSVQERHAILTPNAKMIGPIANNDSDAAHQSLVLGLDGAIVSDDLGVLIEAQGLSTESSKKRRDGFTVGWNAR